MPLTLTSMWTGLIEYLFQDEGQWIVLTIIATIPRLITLGKESLWFDESFDALLIAPKTDFWRAILGDDHPPIWHIIEWINLHIFGNSEFAFRLPSMLFSIGTVLLIYFLAIRLTHDRRAAFVAGLLTGLLPGLLYFGQDGRMYAALAFFVLATLLAVIDNRPILTFLMGLGASYTQNVGVLYVFVMGAGLGVMLLYRYIQMGYPFRIVANMFVRGLAPFVGILLCYIPWLPTLQKQMTMVNASFWMPPITPTNTLWPLYYGWLGDRVPDILQMHAYVLITVLLVVGVWVSRKWLIHSLFNSQLYIVATMGGPLLLASYALITGRNIFVYRPLLATIMLLNIPMAYALCNLKIEYRRIAVRVVAISMVIMLGFYYTYNLRLDIPGWLNPITGQFKSTPNNPNVNIPAVGVDYPLDKLSYFQPGDAIWFTDGTPAILFGHYLQWYPVYLRPYRGDVMSITDEDRAAFAAYLPTATLEQLKAQGYKRVWWIVVRNPFTEQQEIDAIEKTFTDYKPLTIWAQQTSKTSWNFIYRIDF